MLEYKHTKNISLSGEKKYDLKRSFLVIMNRWRSKHLIEIWFSCATNMSPQPY